MIRYSIKSFFSRVGGTLPKNNQRASILIERQQQIRKLEKQSHLKYYHFVQESDFQPELQRVQLYGQEQIVIGFQSDLRSPLNVLNTIDQFDPKCLILGDLSLSKLDEYKLGVKKYQIIPKIYNQDKDLLAKETLTNFFQEDIEFGNKWFHQENHQCVYQVSKQTRQAIMEDSLSVAEQLFEKSERHLLFGKSDSNLVYEDLALRLSLKQLQDIYFNVIQSLSQEINLNLEDQYPYFENERIYNMVHRKARQLYGETLFSKQVLFAASIFKKSARLFKKSSIIFPNELCKQLAMQTLEPMMPEFDEIYRGYIDKEGDKEFFNLKKYSSRKYLNTFKNIRKFFSKDEDQEEILNLAEKQKQKYDFYEKERDQFLNIKEGKANAEEILEKYVILNHLIGKETQLYLQENINPFQVTIYHQIFQDQYSGNTSKILNQYLKLNEKYSIHLHKIQNYQIKRLANYLPEPRPELESFSEQTLRLNNKNKDYKYEFVTGLISLKKRDQITQTLLIKSMLQILKERENEGVSQSDVIKDLKNYFSGNMTQSSIRTYNQLMLEANSCLGNIIKMPKVYKQFLGYLVNLRKYELQKYIKSALEQIEREVNYQKKNNFENSSQNSNNFDISQLSGKRTNQENEDEDQYFDDIFNSKKQFFVLNDQGNFPFDIKGKSEEELIQMGFKQVVETEFQVDENGQIYGVNDGNMKDMDDILKQVKGGKNKVDSNQLSSDDEQK